MRALLLLLITAGLIGMFALGNQYGTINTDKAWDARVTESQELLVEGTYHMAWTNVRACVLAVDSAVMRFLSNPTPEVYRELGARYAACEQHWELLFEYAPKDDETDYALSEARFMFDNWADQLAHMLKLQITLITAHNAGREDQASMIYQSLIKEREESRKFRDHIERELFEAW